MQPWLLTSKKAKAKRANVVKVVEREPSASHSHEQMAVPGLSADFAEGAGHPPRLRWEGKPELTKAPRSDKTAAAGIPEGFRPVEPGRVALGGAGALSPGIADFSAPSFS